MFMALSLYNTLGREIQEFKTIRAGEAGFYGCGPTVYNFAHIGNLRAYISHDLLLRLLRRRGYKVTHVMNITDVGHLTGDNDEGDDKMVKSAEERGKSVLEIAKFYTNAFFDDTARLNITRPDIVCKATEHIDDMIALVQRIEANGYTYKAGGNLYFDISKFGAYAELANLKIESLKAGARIEVDGNKRNAEDFVLWFTKSKFENQALVWDSPWGRGYPGWHIECAAMSIKYLGEQFDIHAGGIDHIRIHHSNEIAEAEAATGRHPWVRHWFHNEFLVLDKGKMSKSQGGFITLQHLIDQGFDALDYRYFLLGGHYRTQLQFSIESLNGARNARKSLLTLIRSLMEKCGKTGNGEWGIGNREEGGSLPPAPAPLCGSSASPSPRGSAPKTPPSSTTRYPLPATHSSPHIATFDAALDDDLNVPRALASLWGVLKDAAVSPRDALAAAFDMDEILGLKLRESAAAKTEAGPGDAALAAEIAALIAERADAKKEKDFARADAIRNGLKERGIILEDRPNGTIWKHE
jgi:cysteinyl-tRNA synthetase